MGWGAYSAEVSPVQQVAQALSSVPLDDPLAPALLTELKQEGSELIAGLIDPSKPPVQDVNAWSDVKGCYPSFPFFFKKKQTNNEKNIRECFKCVKTDHKLRDPLCVPP